MERYEYFKLFHDISKTDSTLLASQLKELAFKKGDVRTVPGQAQKASNMLLFPRLNRR